MGLSRELFTPLSKITDILSFGNQQERTAPESQSPAERYLAALPEDLRALPPEIALTLNDDRERQIISAYLNKLIKPMDPANKYVEKSFWNQSLSGGTFRTLAYLLDETNGAAGFILNPSNKVARLAIEDISHSAAADIGITADSVDTVADPDEAAKKAAAERAKAIVIEQGTAEFRLHVIHRENVVPAFSPQATAWLRAFPAADAGHIH